MIKNGLELWRKIPLVMALFVIALAANAWGACVAENYTVSQAFVYSGSYDGSCSVATWNSVCGLVTCQDTVQRNGYIYSNFTSKGVRGGTYQNTVNCPVTSGSTCSLFDGRGCGGSAYNCTSLCRYSLRCQNQCDIDSIANYANCVNGGHTWSSDSCKCIYNTETDSTFTICTENVTPSGSVYMEAYKVTMHYKNGQVQTACGVSPNLVQGNGYKTYCPKLLQSFGTCKQNGYQNGASPASGGEGNQSPKNQPPQCYATIGYNCYFKDRETGNTFVCECDGSCEKGFNDIANGSCKNPYANSSSSGGDSSASGGDSSASGGDSSASGGDSSASGGGSSASGETGIYMDVLQQIQANTQATMNNTGDISQWTQETMIQTIDIKNQLTETAIDVSHIRTNTENTATNTGNIDGKLSVTNGLLQDIKNKDWNPTINFNPDFNPTIQGDTNIITVQGDTNIVNVEVTGDTAKAPSEILSFLKGLFGGMDTTAQYDTTGWGAVNDSALHEADSTLKKSDWVQSMGCDTTGGRKCDNAVIGAHGLDSAKISMGRTFRALADTIRNGQFADSLRNWGDKFTGGQISGGGSDNCPSVLSRQYTITLMEGASFNLTLGRYLCQPLVGNTTAWSLCRLLLRASVALACMWFLFHCATGFRGSNDED